MNGWIILGLIVLAANALYVGLGWWHSYRLRCIGQLDAPRDPRAPLSQKAQDARRPLPQMLLLDAEQGRPDIPTNARRAQAFRPMRAPAAWRGR